MWGGAAGFELSGIDACCCRHLPAQLLRYGTNVANGGKQLLHHVQFQRVTCGKNSPYFNFCVMCLIASSVPHRANRYFQVIDAIRRKFFFAFVFIHHWRSLLHLRSQRFGSLKPIVLPLRTPDLLTSPSCSFARRPRYGTLSHISPDRFLNRTREPGHHCFFTGFSGRLLSFLAWG